MDSKRKCRVCKGKISIRIEPDYGRGNRHIVLSNEGIFFNFIDSLTGCWFCNKCWDKIRKYDG